MEMPTRVVLAGKSEEVTMDWTHRDLLPKIVRVVIRVKIAIIIRLR